MSYDIELVCPCCGTSIEGTHVKETFNRHKIYYDKLDKEQGIRWLYGKSYAQIKDRCHYFIKEVGTDINGYFYDGEDVGYAGIIIQKILTYAKEYPFAVIKGD
jgi:hypothetical protein